MAFIWQGSKRSRDMTISKIAGFYSTTVSNSVITFPQYQCLPSTRSFSACLPWGRDVVQKMSWELTTKKQPETCSYLPVSHHLTKYPADSVESRSAVIDSADLTPHARVNQSAPEDTFYSSKLWYLSYVAVRLCWNYPHTNILPTYYLVALNGDSPRFFIVPKARKQPHHAKPYPFSTS